MTHPNIELVARLFTAFASGDSEAIASGMSPEIRWHSSGFDGTAGDYVGIPAVLAYLHGEDHAPQTQMRVLDVLASDDRAALVARTSAADGTKSLDDEWVLLLHLVDGMVDEAWTYKWDQRAWAAFLPAGDGRAP